MPPYSYDCSFYKCRPISIIFGMGHGVNFQHNGYCFTHITYALLLHYLGKQVKFIVHNDNFQFYQPKLHITVAQSKTISSLSAQPVEVLVQLLQQVFKMSFFIHTGLKSLPLFVNGIVHSNKLPYAMYRSSAVSDRSRLKLASDTHDPASSYLTVNRTKIRTIRRPKV